MGRVVVGPMTPDPLLDVRDLSLSYATGSGAARVLDGVSLTLARGEIMGLVGESGCGKTSLARAILGALPPNARMGGGVIRFRGEDLLTLDPAEAAARIRGRAITFVPQDPFTAFSPLFTLGDQIDELMRWKSPNRPPDAPRSTYARPTHARPTRAHPPTRTRRREDRAHAEALLGRVGLADPARLFGRYPHELSGGQRQRVMIAMALLPEPALVIADEPTTALDVTIQARILRMLRDLAGERGVSVLLTTHDLGAAWEICDRITVMYAGQALETAPIEAFVRAPRVPYTRMLLDSLPTGAAPLRGIPGEVPGLVSPPAGCPFHPRCPSASDLCRATRPPVTEPAPGHQIRCHHPLAAA